MANALIDTAASGDVTIVAAPANGAIGVFGYNFITAGSDSVYLAAGVDSVKLTGTFVLTAQAGIVCPATPDYWFILPNKTALIINKAAAVQLGGHVKYGVIQ